jgi:hypothetical protein
MEKKGTVLTTKEIEAKRPILAGSAISNVVPTLTHGRAFVTVLYGFKFNPEDRSATIGTPSRAYFLSAVGGDVVEERALKLPPRESPAPLPAADAEILEWSRLQDDLVKSFYSGARATESATKIARYQLLLPRVFGEQELGALTGLAPDWFEWLKQGSGH